MADFTLRRSRKLLSPAELPLLIQPGPIHPEWSEAAEAKAFTFIARVRDRQHVALRCNACGGINAVRINVLMGYNPHCHHCLDTARTTTAEVAGLRFLHRDPEDHKYAFYQMACGHKIRRQFGRIARISTGAGAARCETCLVHREEAEAARFGWERRGRDPKDNISYRLYRHHCGHEQRIAVANVRWGQCDCAGCGQSWTAKPSFIYLLDIRHAATKRHYLKLGYSSHPVKRHKHQLGLPKDAEVEVLWIVAMPTGHDACAMEKAAHARLKRAHPEALVLNSEYADLMNVVSEIYKPEALFILQNTLDRIEEEIAGAARARSPDALSVPPQTTADNNPERAQDDTESHAPGASVPRTPAPPQLRRKPRPVTVSRDPNPILRRHWGLTG